MSLYHSILRRGLKWYTKVMFEFLFGTCVVNTWIIYNRISEKKNYQSQLLGKQQDSLEHLWKPQTKHLVKEFLHLLIHLVRAGRKINLQGVLPGSMQKCIQANKTVSKVTSYCDTCPGKPGLCLVCVTWCKQFFILLYEENNVNFFIENYK